MNREQLLQLILRAQMDPDFFHKLVFDPDHAASIFKPQIGSADNAPFPPQQECSSTCSVTNNAMKSLRTGALDSKFGGSSIICDDTYTCCCTSGTCGSTCGGRTCDVTCSGESCGSTCGDSCGYTTHLQSLF